MIKSPFTKFHLLLFSFAFSRFYLYLHDQRALPHNKRSLFIRLVYKRQSYLFTLSLWGFFAATFLFYLLIGRSALKNPYLWTRWQNTWFYGFAKFIIFMDLFLFMFLIFTKNPAFLTPLFSHKYFTFVAKLCAGVYVIYPTVIFFLYGNGAQGFYINYPNIVYGYVHHLLVSMIISLIFLLVLIIPFFNILNRLKITLA